MSVGITEEKVEESVDGRARGIAKRVCDECFVVTLCGEGADCALWSLDAPGSRVRGARATELKPCPFCGGKAKVECLGKGQYQAKVGCAACGAAISRFFRSKADAAEAWNARRGVGA